jgi:hypothetical protein
MIRHQLGLTEANLDVRFDNRFRIRTCDPIEAVGDGANLNATELGVDLGCAERPGQGNCCKRELSDLSSGKIHLFLSG